MFPKSVFLYRDLRVSRVFYAKWRIAEQMRIGVGSIEWIPRTDVCCFGGPQKPPQRPAGGKFRRTDRQWHSPFSLLYKAITAPTLSLSWLLSSFSVRRRIVSTNSLYTWSVETRTRARSPRIEWSTVATPLSKPAAYRATIENDLHRRRCQGEAISSQ